MNVIIVHGANVHDRENIKKYNLPPQNERGWIKWVKEELVRRGVKCFNPLMPENWNPKYSEWKREFEKIKVDERSILVGHSAGAAFLVRWLRETKKKIKKLILVAPASWIKRLSDEVYGDLYDFKIDPLIGERANKIIIFTSDNDSEEIRESVKIYSKKFDVEPIVFKGFGHFTERSMKTKEFPELLEEVLK